MGGIDASIYSQIRPVQMPDVGDAMQKGMTLAQLGMQNQQMQLQMQTQQAIRDAYAKNVRPDGQLDKQGVLSDLARTSPQAMQQLQEHFNKTDKDQADAQSSQAGAYQKRASIAANGITYVAKLPQELQEKGYNDMINHLVSAGVAAPGQFPAYSPNTLNDLAIKAQQHMGQNSADYLGNEKTKAETAQAYASADKTRSETIKQNPGLAGQMNDPAKLVPRMVPKEHQAKALGEIDAAENTRRMAKAIMDSYDQADKDISGVAGTAKSLVKDPRSVYALHQAMQPTFKDLEGTVRQAAMDNTFKNITPSYGDSAQDRATKRQALQDYLQSKLSAPTARAYGIDLTQFDSTAPYKSAPNQQGQGGGGLINSANAAPPAALTAREHSAAVDWANKNSSDPRAKKILQINGVK